MLSDFFRLFLTISWRFDIKSSWDFIVSLMLPIPERISSDRFKWNFFRWKKEIFFFCTNQNNDKNLEDLFLMRSLQVGEVVFKFLKRIIDWFYSLSRGTGNISIFYYFSLALSYVPYASSLGIARCKRFAQTPVFQSRQLKMKLRNSKNSIS